MRTPEEKEKARRIGYITENLVKEYLEEAGYVNVKLSEDKYDSVKDITAEYNGQLINIECKARTQVRKFNMAFPLEKSQWNKADNAKLFFISMPDSYNNFKVDIYESNGEEYTVEQFGPTNMSQKPTRMYRPALMNKVKSITDSSTINLLTNLNFSKNKNV